MMAAWPLALSITIAALATASCDPAPMRDQGPTKAEAEALTGETFERKDACFALRGRDGYECAFIGKHPNGQRVIIVHAFVKKDERWSMIEPR